MQCPKISKNYEGITIFRNLHMPRASFLPTRFLYCKQSETVPVLRIFYGRPRPVPDICRLTAEIPGDTDVTRIGMLMHLRRSATSVHLVFFDTFRVLVGFALEAVIASSLTCAIETAAT